MVHGGPWWCLDMNTVARANHDSPNNQSPYTPHRVNTPTPGSPYSPSRAVALPNSPYMPSRSRNNSNVDLARRNTSPAVPASPIRNTFVANTSPRGASPQRNTFASSPQRSTFAPAVRSSPALGGSPTVRARAQTEPAPGSPTNPMSLLLQSDQERDSSAYAALAALNAAAGPSGHTGYGGAHPAYPGLGHGHPNANAGYIHARPQLETLYQETSTPGSTPPLTGDVRDESASEEDGESEDAEDTNNGEKPRRVRNGKLLTPPATPPRHSLVVASANVDLANDLPHAHTDLSEYTHHTHDEFCSRPTFNARKASAQCRQLEGYVSFAAVEGLGEPPSPGPSLGEDDEEELPERRRKRGSLGAGIVGLWRGTFW
ncbi:hypothetical protein C8F01DRAFT_1102021 [Mycena amicta]|nr:hypothetical protein C8F01DRAFT_1102021 [Mycena amicta]